MLRHVLAIVVTTHYVKIIIYFSIVVFAVINNFGMLLIITIFPVTMLMLYHLKI